MKCRYEDLFQILPIVYDYVECFMSTVTREKNIDLAKKQSTRNVYECHVLGAVGTGKSMLCRSHIGQCLEVKYILYFRINELYFY